MWLVWWTFVCVFWQVFSQFFYILFNPRWWIISILASISPFLDYSLFKRNYYNLHSQCQSKQNLLVHLEKIHQQNSWKNVHGKKKNVCRLTMKYSMKKIHIHNIYKLIVISKLFDTFWIGVKCFNACIMQEVLFDGRGGGGGGWLISIFHREISFVASISLGVPIWPANHHVYIG